MASVLYIVPQIYGLEATDQADRLNGFANGLGGVPAALSAAGDAGVNALAWPILIGSLILFALTGAFLFGRFLLTLGRQQPTEDTTAASV